jgi:hypothetical protein
VAFNPLDLHAKLAALVPRPHKNIIVYHGVLSPHARLRQPALAYGREPLAAPPVDGATAASKHERRAVTQTVVSDAAAGAFTKRLAGYDGGLYVEASIVSAPEHAHKPGRNPVNQMIDIGYQAFVSDDPQEFGAIRYVSPERHEVTVYVENAGEFVVTGDAIQEVHDQKVIFDCAKLQLPLRVAIGHAHESEVPGL